MTADYSWVQIVAILTHKIAELQSQSLEAGFSDLTLRQIYYLDTIQRLQNPTPTELAQTLKISKPSVSTAVDRLCEVGYVRKVKSDEDRRSFHLHLTDKAEHITRAHAQVHAQISALLTSGLDRAEVEQLTFLMNKVLQALAV
jgi:DNA-binding MarR family transcriptional regulator